MDGQTSSVVSDYTLIAFGEMCQVIYDQVHVVLANLWRNKNLSSHKFKNKSHKGHRATVITGSENTATMNIVKEQ